MSLRQPYDWPCCQWSKRCITSWNGNILRVTGPLWGESTGHWWIPLIKASGMELWCFLWFAPDQTVSRWWIEMQLGLLWRHCNACVNFLVITVCGDAPVPWGVWPSASTAMTDFRARHLTNENVLSIAQNMLNRALVWPLILQCRNRYHRYQQTRSSLWLQMPSLQWRHYGHDSVSNHQPHDCLLNRLFRRRSKKASKLRVTGLCAVNSPVTGEFPAQMASNAENVSIWWRHHGE